MPAGFDRPYSVCTIEIKRDEDWSDEVLLQRLNSDGSISVLDFMELLDENGLPILDENGLPIRDSSGTGTRMDLYIRPLFDHTILIHKLSSELSEGGELQFDPDVPGALHIEVTRANVIANIPTGSWQQFLVATYPSGFTEEFWRGPLIVHPGRTP